MRTQTEELVCPWPGLQPYEEKDADIFFGRVREAKLLRQKILSQNFTILIAASGAGKTSLLRAGLVPALRLCRRKERDRLGPTLLLRNWGGVRSGPPGQLLVWAIREDIERMLRFGSKEGRNDVIEDAQNLDAVTPPPCEGCRDAPERVEAVLDYLRDLCHTVGSLVLIVDQAEELMGSGLPRVDRAAEREVLDILGAIFAREKRVRVLLSLREEYLSRLRALDVYVDSLANRTVSLPPLEEKTARQVVSQSGGRCERLRLADDVVGTIVKCVTAEMQDEQQIADGSEPVDLLRLQALLVELFDHAMEKQGGKEIAITRPVLEDYREKYGRGGVSRGALQRCIQKKLTTDPQLASAERPSSALVRRVAARMPQWLSSSGPESFKRHLEEAELIQHAVEEDLNVLARDRAKAPDFGDQVRRALLNMLGDGGEAPTARAKLGTLFDTATDSPAQQGIAMRSGAAIAYGWSDSRTAEMLVQAALDALRLLKRGNILKVGHNPGGTGRICELVHDGLGVALIAWAESQVRSVEHTLASVVASCGTQFQWSEFSTGDRPVERLSWYGCTLSRIGLHNVVFENCDFPGCLFLHCTFDACHFKDCNFGGALFRGCTWKDVTWTKCIAPSVLVAGGSWSDVTIKNSLLDNATISDAEKVILSGGAELRDCSIRFGQVGGFQNPHRLSVTGCDLLNCLFDDYDRKRFHNEMTEGLRLSVPPLTAPRHMRQNGQIRQGQDGHSGDPGP